jgi:glycine/D-amino acid oxidase-like deaminating enzyme
LPGCASNARAPAVPDDETGDCHLFTQRLMATAEGIGVRFVGSTRIESIGVDNNRITSLFTDSGPMTADSYVVALGSFSPQLLQPIGIDVSVYPVKGIRLPCRSRTRAVLLNRQLWMKPALHQLGGQHRNRHRLTKPSRPQKIRNSPVKTWNKTSPAVLLALVALRSQNGFRRDWS